jgi:hypothetical protein
VVHPERCLGGVCCSCSASSLGWSSVASVASVPSTRPESGTHVRDSPIRIPLPLPPFSALSAAWATARASSASLSFLVRFFLLISLRFPQATSIKRGGLSPPSPPSPLGGEPLTFLHLAMVTRTKIHCHTHK